MNKIRPLVRFVFLPFTCLTLFGSFASAQSESPVQGSHSNVIEGAPTGSVRAEIVPLIWKAEIRDSLVNVPLASVEYFGVQTYDVDGVARVRELTITTKSRSMIRIYHMSPISGIAEHTENTLKALNQIVDGVDPDNNAPVKVFPSTTHAHMTEYRVLEKADIDKLYKHLETAMKDYHARVLTPAQRDQTIREVKVGVANKSDTEGKIQIGQ